MQNENLFESYKANIRKQRGSILFSVINGKLSEGIDFKDKLARAVLVVGLPFPNKNDVVLLQRQKFYNKFKAQTKRGLSGNEYYESKMYKAVNQSIGRAIRHKDDYAIIFLVDARYEQKQYSSKLPQYVKNNLMVFPDHYGNQQNPEIDLDLEIQDFFDRFT